MVETARRTRQTNGSRRRKRHTQEVRGIQDGVSRVADTASLNPIPENCDAREDGALIESKNNQKVTGSSVDVQTDVETCIICASDIIHEGFGPCNHRTCHVCSLRMRVLFKDQTCSLCRLFAPYIIITDNRNKCFEDYTDEYFKGLDFPSIDDKIGLRFESLKIREDVFWMLGYNCPEKGCDVTCLAWTHLHDHTRRAHNKKICDLCSKHRKIFPHEHDLFTDAELSKHMKYGDNDSKSTNRSGFKGHPLCNFCGSRYYDDDELFRHLREKHERCFVCDRANPGKSPSYYINYEALRSHFAMDHFMCQMKDCLDQKYIAFVSEFELKVHMLEVHGDVLPKDALRDARNIDLSDFSYRQPYEHERRSINNQRIDRERGMGIGRDLAMEYTVPINSQPLRRDEQAYRRQLAIGSSQSSSSTNIGHQSITSILEDTKVKEPRPNQSLGPVGNTGSRTKNSSDNPNSVQTNFSLSERVRSLRHATVNERISLLLKKDSSKISQYHSSLSRYIDGKSTGRTVVEDFFCIFADISTSALDTLVTEISESMEDQNKADELRTAWNNWRAINENYPSLPAASLSTEGSGLLQWATRNRGASPLEPGRSTSTSVKKPKAQSAVTPFPPSRSWDPVSRSTGTIGEGSSIGRNRNMNEFPSLRSQVSQDAIASRKSPSRTWASSTKKKSTSIPNGSKIADSSSKKACNSFGGMSSRMKIQDEAFPALPILSKLENNTSSQKRIIVKKNSEGPPENAWRENEEAISGIRSMHETANQEAESSKQGKKKGNKTKKQVLIGWG